jgi:hypothetical protein
MYQKNWGDIFFNGHISDLHIACTFGGLLGCRNRFFVGEPHSAEKHGGFGQKKRKQGA